MNEMSDENIETVNCVSECNLTGQTVEEQMMTFANSSLWNFIIGTFSDKSGGEVKIKLDHETPNTFTGKEPVKKFIESDAQKISLGVKINYPVDADWAVSNYLGNLQLFISDKYDTEFDWLGQFEINLPTDIGDNERVFEEQELILTDYFCEKLKSKPQYIRFRFSGNSGAEFCISEICLKDAS